MTKSIKAKLLARFGAVGVALILAATMVGILATNVRTNVSEALGLTVESLRLASQIEYDVVQVQGWLTDISATRAAEGYADGFDEAATWAEEFHADVETLVALHPEQAEPMAELTATFESFYAMGQEMAHAYIDGGPAAGNAMMDEFDGAAEAMALALETVHADIDGDVTAMEDEVAQTLGTLRSVTVAGTLAVLLGVVVMALRTASGLSRPLVEMARAATGAAAGDTSVEVQHRSDDELGTLADALRSLTGYLQAHAATASAIADGDIDQEVEPTSDRDTLGQAMQRMVSTLRDLLGAVTSASSTLGRQADELSNASGDLTASAESVAATITHLAGAAIEQTTAADAVNENVASIVEQLTEFAALTQSIVDAADGAVAQSGKGADNVAVIHQTMRSTVAAIDEAAGMVDDLGRRSEQVSQAVVLIQQIADQTNLLALNAAIEAARAGEAGRGFAVVATEVKQLAEQASASAGQIADIVSAMTGSVQQVVASTEAGRSEVKRGADLIDGLDGDLGAIRTASQSVLDDIRSASDRIEVVQRAVEGIVGSIGELSQTTESNAAATEEVAAASEESAATADEVQRSAQALGDVAGSLERALGAFAR